MEANAMEKIQENSKINTRINYTTVTKTPKNILLPVVKRCKTAICGLNQ